MKSLKRTMKAELRFAFFGTPDIAVSALEEIERAGYSPELIITAPDKPQGRGMQLTPPPVKVWAESRGIDVLQPEKIDEEFIKDLRASHWDLFLVVAYGKILPEGLLAIPARGTLNIHPSLLPRFRGPSPVRSAILADEHTGTTVMKIDEKMDHGPIIAQKRIEPSEWPPAAITFENELVREGAKLLAQILPEWIAGTIEAHEQNHDVATYCAKIKKEDGLLDLSADARSNLLKIRAYEGWPGTFAFFQRNGKKIRVQILEAHIEDDALIIDTVKPEGKKEMPYEEFLRSGATVFALDK